MKHSTLKWIVVTLALATIMVVGGCKHPPKPTPPLPPPPPPTAPTASISANPNDIQAGQSAQLTWSTENATDVSIDGIGKVDPSGTQSVTPSDSTSYHLVAKGPGGSQEATTRITVTKPAPPPPPPPPTVHTPSDDELLQQNLKDVFFDYDSFDVKPADQQNLSAAARFLTTEKPNWKIQLEGYCDERGSTEYNLALGQSRADAAKQALMAAGVTADRIRTTSFGKEKPFCTESNEACWQQNRRAHFALQK